MHTFLFWILHAVKLKCIDSPKLTRKNVSACYLCAQLKRILKYILIQICNSCYY